jgi:hypothetical protein
LLVATAGRTRVRLKGNVCDWSACDRCGGLRVRGASDGSLPLPPRAQGRVRGAEFLGSHLCERLFGKGGR